MTITSYKPKSPLLQQYIECFYILTQEEKEQVGYITFPSIYTIVTIIANAKFHIEDNKVHTSYCDSSPLVSSIVSRFKEPLYLNYEGQINEITIYFKPLGISAFLKHPVSHYSKNDYDLFYPYPDFETAMRQLLKQTDTEEKIQLLEAYWLSKYEGIKNKNIADIVTTILQSDDKENTVVHHLAKKFNLSRKTIHKYFLQYVGKTPSEFLKTKRFREAIDNKFSNTPQDNLTAIAYAANYFDQSHMTKDFKSLTGQNPKAFFNKTSIVKKKEKIFWQFK